MENVNEFAPTFNVRAYANGLIAPAVTFLVIDILYLIFSFLESDNSAVPINLVHAFVGSGNFSWVDLIVLLFGGWAGLNIIRAKGSIGDAMLGGLIMGLWMEFWRWLLFWIINEPDSILGVPFDLSYKADYWPSFYFTLTFSIAAAAVFVGLFSDSLSDEGETDWSVFTPAGGSETLKKALLFPITTWLIVNVLFLIFSFIDPNDEGYAIEAEYGQAGVSLEAMLFALIFSLWIANNAMKSGGSLGDAAIAGIIFAIVAAIIRYLFFWLINAPDVTVGSDEFETFLDVFYANLMLFLSLTVAYAGIRSNNVIDIMPEGTE
ncbi:MAG: hypothetical protein ACXAB7_03325 [Candidatus Kariarchaeaceae archaeon]|jgi:hypothetical protein